MINNRESLLCNLLPVKFDKCSIALFSFNTFYVGKWFMYVISLDSNLKYNFIVLCFTHCRTYRSCGRRVMCQYFLWKIMLTLLLCTDIRSRVVGFGDKRQSHDPRGGRARVPVRWQHARQRGRRPRTPPPLRPLPLRKSPLSDIEGRQTRAKRGRRHSLAHLQY